MSISGSTVSLCKDPVLPWNSVYSFEWMADGPCLTCPTFPGGGGQGRMQKAIEINPIRVQSPFSEYINIYFPESGFLGGLKHVVLQDINGKVIFYDKIDVPEPLLTIPVGNVPPGFYLLKIESNGTTQVLKAIKS